MFLLPFSCPGFNPGLVCVMFTYLLLLYMKGFIGPPGASGAPGIQGERVSVMLHEVGGAKVLNDSSDCSD